MAPDRIPIDDAILGFSLSATRLAVLRLVLSARCVSTAQIMEECCLSRNGALKHLRALENAGMVTGSHVTHPRGAGPITYWLAEPDAVIEAIDAIEAELLAGVLL